MKMIRRNFLLGAAALGAARSIAASHGQARASFKAIAFDGFPIIDPRLVSARAEEAFPGRGAELVRAWRIRQFEYTWLRTLSRRYVDFWQVTQEALVVSAKSTGLELAASTRDRLMQTFLELTVWPDVEAALKELKARRIRMAFLANPTERMLEAPIQNSGLDGLLEPPLSVDRVQAYKPDPRAYQMGLDAFGLRPEEIVFVASASWDAAGAKAFGYTSFWVNREKLPVESLGPEPDGIGTGMADLVKFVLG